jgi:uncharacterized membrane protein YphA (DoxX/SURF4 family)
MSLSHSASLQLAPLFTRIILATIVLPAGYVAAFRTANFTSEEAARIEAMGTPSKLIENTVEKIKPAAWRVESPADAPADDADRSADGTHPLRSLNRLALRLDDAKVPQPLVVAWACAVAEMIGGVMLLAGLLTRWFALLILVGGVLRMGLLTWPQVRGALPWDWTVGQMNLFAATLAAVLLALSLVLTGPGRFSMDRLIFPRSDGD